MMTAVDLIWVADLAATGIFAVTGALVASRKRMDIFGFVWFAALTGVGGGTLRDLCLGVPVFWVETPLPLMVCFAVGLIMHFVAQWIGSRQRVILWFDAYGLAFATIAGALKATSLQDFALISLVMGIFSGSAGGIIRDVIGQETSIILRREVYVSAAALGATVFVVLHNFDVATMTAAAFGFLACLLPRILAIHFAIQLPAYRPRAGREFDPHNKSDQSE